MHKNKIFKKLFLPLLFVFCILISSCPNPFLEKLLKPFFTDIVYYHAGYYNGDPVYWVNGVMTKLELPFRISGENVYINAITASGDTVYTTGYYKNQYQSDAGVYWINEKIFEIMPANISAESSKGIAITVSDNKIYIAGEYIPVGPNAQNTPFFWVDGLLTELSASSYNTWVASITVSDSDVYVAGVWYDSNYTNAYGCYWVNGNRTDFPLNLTFNGVYDITLSGSSVYISALSYYGSVFYFNNDSSSWYNLNDPPGMSYASVPNSITVYKNIFYTAGCVIEKDLYGAPDWGKYHAAYWINSEHQQIFLPDNEINSFVDAIELHEDNIYKAGWCNVIDGGITSALLVSWVNGEPTVLGKTELAEKEYHSFIQIRYN